jgi:predicted ArsR family transcriptional regulator
MDPKIQPYVERYKLAVAFYQALKAELGEPQALAIAQKGFETLQKQVAHDLAEQLGGNSLGALAEHIRKQAAERENQEVVEINDRLIATRTTYCPAPAAFAALGAPELCRLYCDSDYEYIKAFNPKMRMVRTKTIAAGDDYCDHMWVLDE